MTNDSTSFLLSSRGSVTQRLMDFLNGLTVTCRRFLGFMVILSLALAPSPTFGQTTDSTQTSNVITDTLTQIQSKDFSHELEDDFSPGLGLFALFAFGFMIICIVAGIILTIVALLILFGLVGAGILSASVLIGLSSKSYEKGFKTFIVSATTIGGLFIGATGFWLLNKIIHWFTTQTALAIGAVAGLLTGLLLGLLLFYVLQKMTTFLKNKLKTT